MPDYVLFALLQEQVPYSAGGVLRFFAGVLLILTLYGGAMLFTYWISKDE